MNFRITQPEDIEQLRLNGVSGGKYDPQAEVDFCATLEQDGKVLIVGGIRKITPTTAWAYAELTSDAGSYIYTVYRVTREWLDKLCKDNGVLRLQAWVETGHPNRIRWVEHLGFKKEYGPMRHFAGKDVSADIYVKYFEE